MSASWFLVSTYLILIFGSKLNSVQQPSSAAVWVPDTCLIAWLRLFIIILITASLSSKMYNWDSPWEECVFVVLWVFLYLVGGRMKHFNHQIPEIKSGNSIHAQTRIKRNNLSFRQTVWDWSLFLTHPSHGNKRVTAKDAQDSTRSRFWVFKISGKARVLEQSWSALLLSISHMTTLLKFTRAEYVRNEASQASVTGPGPFCDCCSCKCVYWPSNVCSANACQIKTFQDERIRLTILPQISALLHWIGGHQGMELKLQRIAELFCWPARNTAPHISLHDLPYRRAKKRCAHQVCPELGSFSVTPAEILDILHSRWVQHK